MNISKELLSAVLGKKVSRCGFNSNLPNMVVIQYEGKDPLGNFLHLNIHELANMVKKWAKTKGWSINSNLKYCWAMSIECADEDYDIEGLGKHTEQADTEPEAIFKAGEWVLKETSK